MDTIESQLEKTRSSANTSLDQMVDWLKRYTQESEAYLKDDFRKVYGPHAKMSTIPEFVTTYFNELENNTTDPKRLAEIRKVRELTETTYLNQRNYLNGFIDSQARKIAIQQFIYTLKKGTAGLQQIISSN